MSCWESFTINVTEGKPTFGTPKPNPVPKQSPMIPICDYSRPIRIEAYRDFYDIPRAFVVRLNSGSLLFFDSPFEDYLDDYSP